MAMGTNAFGPEVLAAYVANVYYGVSVLHVPVRHSAEPPTTEPMPFWFKVADACALSFAAILVASFFALFM